MDPLRRALRAEVDRAVAEAAARRGLVTEAWLAQAIDEHERTGAPLIALLVERGWLEESAVASLRRAVAAEDFLRAHAPAAGDLPPGAREAAADPARRLAEFALVAPIGRGATGEVWKAWDLTLGRWVAVKVSSAFLTSDAARERFQREALAAARLSHANIAPIHRVGIDGDRIFLVMPFIDGETLDRARLPVRRALEVMRDVARAVEHAHAHGVLHRDLKPGNLMLDRDGVVFVLDFGVAYLREERSSALTQPGDPVGTAGFMSPEQARGDPDSRLVTADVYGLGATLYYLLTGVAPFSGAALAEIVRRVLEDEPVAPRALRPEIDAASERVVLTALAKDRRQRYPSAAAFAADLDRLLAGEETRARPVGWAGRARRRLGRHRAVAAALVTAAVALGAGLLSVARVRSEKRRSIAAMRTVARMSLDTALRLRRAGDLAGMRQVLPNLVAAYDEVERLGAVGAETEYLMGRMYRALMDEARARAHQEHALAIDPRHVPALYEHAVLSSTSYGRELDRAVARLRLAGPEAEAERAEPALVASRTAIVEEATRLAAVPLGATDAEAVHGILAYHRRAYEDARARLEKLVALDPLREEVWETLAATALAQGRPAAAVEVYTRALERDRGYLPHLVGRCRARSAIDVGTADRLPDAIADASAALALDPRLTDAYQCRGAATALWIELGRTGPNDLAPAVAAAVSDFDRAEAAHANAANALWGRASVRYNYAAFVELRRGRDPSALLDAAERDLRRCTEVAAEQQNGTCWAYLGWTAWARAVLRDERGQDPTEEAERSVAAFTRALALGSKRFAPNHAQGRADSRALLAAFHARQGRRELATRELAAVDEDMRWNDVPPLSAWVHDSRGKAYTLQARVRALGGHDPGGAWARGEDAFARALAMAPSDPDPWANRALLRIDRAVLATGTPARRAADLAAAAQDIDRALHLHPEHATAWLAKGHLACATGARAAARSAHTRALTIDPLLARDARCGEGAGKGGE